MNGLDTTKLGDNAAKHIELSKTPSHLMSSAQLKSSVQIKCVPFKGLKVPNINAVQPKINWVIKPNQYVVLKADHVKTMPQTSTTSVLLSQIPKASDENITLNDSDNQVKSFNVLKYKSRTKPQIRVINSEIRRRGYVSSIDEESDGFLSPTMRWNTQPKSYKGARKGSSMIRNAFGLGTYNFDTTDGETSGMGSSVDEPLESSTESASEASTPFFPPRTSPQTIKKRRGGWPKGRKRKPETISCKYPKGPVTAYILFLNEKRKWYKEAYPNLATVEVTKLLGAEWSSMSAEQKEIYVQLSEQDRRRYRNEMQAFRQSSDYQVYQHLLRKKRTKNALRKGQNSNEESSDFTDEIDDDDEYDLYCRTCDQHFSSMHNKREHMYGRHHLQVVSGKIERGKQIVSKRRKRDIPSSSPRCLYDRPAEFVGASAVVADSDDDCLFSTEGESTNKSESMSWRESAGMISTTEDDHDYEDDDEENNDFDETDSVNRQVNEGTSDSLNQALENIMSQVKDREQEVVWSEKTVDERRVHHENLSQELRELEKRQKQLLEEQRLIAIKEKQIKQQVESLWKLPNVLDDQTPSSSNINTQSDSMPSSQPMEYEQNIDEYMELLPAINPTSVFVDSPNYMYTIVEPKDETELTTGLSNEPSLNPDIDVCVEDIFSDTVLEDTEYASAFNFPFSIN